MTKDEIINDLEQQIDTLKALLKLKDEMIELLKSRQNEIKVFPFSFPINNNMR
jgi:hypothetical protein